MILRDHPKIRDTWPPEPGGALPAGFQSPQGGVDVLDEVLYYSPVANAKADIALRTKFAGQEFTRDILLDDATFATRLASWLRQQTGKTIQEIGGSELGF
jgi:hypothetical protein